MMQPVWFAGPTMHDVQALEALMVYVLLHIQTDSMRNPIWSDNPTNLELNIISHFHNLFKYEYEPRSYLLRIFLESYILEDSGKL
jgi:hypothetical protein